MNIARSQADESEMKARASVHYQRSTNMLLHNLYLVSSASEMFNSELTVKIEEMEAEFTVEDIEFVRRIASSLGEVIFFFLLLIFDNVF